MNERERDILHAELRGSTTEFLGWLTGLKPPEDKESIPPEMRAAFDRMVDRLMITVGRCADERNMEMRAALQKLMDCSRAIVGADQKDDRSAEAFDMFWASHAAARAALRAALTTSQRAEK